MNGAFEFLTVESDGAVARITLRRAPLNILHLPMIEELNRAIEGLEDESALRALVLAAEGKAFSAGVAVADHMPDKVRATIGAFHGVFRRLARLGCPTVAAVQGAALGGGCELACFADWVIAGEAATLGLPEIKLGSFPPLAAVHFPRRIGPARTLQMILSGEVMSSRNAEAIGLVDRVVAGDALSASVEALVASLREKSAAVLRLARQATVAAAGSFENALAQVETIFLDRLMTTEDAVEGLAAFLEKRAPVWTHRGAQRE
jgi:cyclohexa-1,5-dienecarbonyl-CoA hydratase